MNLSWSNGKVPMTMQFSEEAVMGTIDDGAGNKVAYRGRYQYTRATSADKESALRMLIEYAVGTVKKQALIELALKFAKDGTVSIRGTMTSLNDGSQTELPPSTGDVEEGGTSQDSENNAPNQAWADLPVGSVLAMVPGDPSAGILSFSCVVDASGGIPTGKMVLNGKEASDGSATFMFQKSGTKAQFVASFTFTDSSAGAAPVYKQVDVQMSLDFKETDANSEKIPSLLEGNCSSYKIRISTPNGIDASAQNYSGNGSFSIQSR